MFVLCQFLPATRRKRDCLTLTRSSKRQGKRNKDNKRKKIRERERVTKRRIKIDRKIDDE